MADAEVGDYGSETDAMISIRKVKCTGDEAFLHNCSLGAVVEDICSGIQNSGVLCQGEV